LELPFWLSRPCCRVRRWREAAEVTAVAVTVVAVTVVAVTVAAVTVAAVTVAAVISAEVISAEVMAEVGAAAWVACISAVATTPVRDSPSHIRFREGACTAAVLLSVAAGGTSV
jgi:hypothetical protein